MNNSEWREASLRMCGVPSDDGEDTWVGANAPAEKADLVEDERARLLKEVRVGQLDSN